MKFELNQAIIDEIVFGMENQDGESVFDTLLGTLVLIDEKERQDSASEADRYIDLPEWSSRDGFSLMETFAETVRNPIVREDLKQILRSGKGVFRQFKDRVHGSSDVEKQWFAFKNREMQHRVRVWYNEQREYWGLEPLEIEIDEEPETGDLVKTDFQIIACPPEQGETIRDWDKALFHEIFSVLRPDERELWYGLSRTGIPLPASGPLSNAVLAQSPAGETVGFVWALEAELPTLSGTIRMGRVVQVGVQKAFRGLGISKILLAGYRDQAALRGVQRIVIDVPGSAEFISKSLRRVGYVPHAVSWELEI